MVAPLIAALPMALATAGVGAAASFGMQALTKKAAPSMDGGTTNVAAPVLPSPAPPAQQPTSKPGRSGSFQQSFLGGAAQAATGGGGLMGGAGGGGKTLLGQ